MAILKVARMGHPVLRAKARPIDPAQITSPPVQQLIDDMFETMHEYQGVGLAAPQIHESLRLFVAGFPPDEDEDEDASRALISDRLQVPMDRWGEPHEIGKVAAFLASDDASFITGQPIVVDGGFMAR